MSQETPSLASVFQLAIRASMAGVRVAIPARVEAYDAAKQTVDVKPMVKDVLVDSEGNRLVESIPVLPDIPVCFPRGGGFFVSFPLRKGDFVQLLVNDRSLDQWRAKAREADPADLRMHDLSDAVAIPGVYPDTEPLAEADANDMVVGHDGGALLRIKTDGTVQIGASGSTMQAVALAGDVKARLDALRGTVNDLINAYNSHVHITTATVGASAVPGVISATVSSAVAPAAVAEVGSSKVKVEE